MYSYTTVRNMLERPLLSPNAFTDSTLYSTSPTCIRLQLQLSKTSPSLNLPPILRQGLSRQLVYSIRQH
jgi:hypothetical protein